MATSPSEAELRTGAFERIQNSGSTCSPSANVSPTYNVTHHPQELWWRALLRRWAQKTKKASKFYTVLLSMDYGLHQALSKALQSACLHFPAKLFLSTDSLSILHLIPGKICFWSNMHSHALWQTTNQIRKIINLVLSVLEEWYMLYLPHQKSTHMGCNMSTNCVCDFSHS